MKEKCVLWVVMCLLISWSSLKCEESSLNIYTNGRSNISWNAPLILKQNRIFTKASVNSGRELNFWVDNGWSQTTVDSRLLDPESLDARRQIRFTALNRKGLSAHSGIVEELRIGELQLSNPEVRCSDIFSKVTQSFKYRVSGILGYNSLKSFKVTFDFRNKKIVFEKSLNDANVKPEGFVKKGILSWDNKLLNGKNAHVFSVKLFINDIPVDAFIDLGFEGSILTTLDNKKISVFSNGGIRKSTVRVLGHSGEGFHTKAQKVSLAGFEEKNVPLIHFKNEQISDFTLIGVTFIKRFTITIDYPNKLIYLNKL